ncbi:MAG: acyl-CoA thioesterase [Eubacteriales bacterium]|nr:acyl-CoA thioesterase [Eubacteriales bacterium]
MSDSSNMNSNMNMKNVTGRRKTPAESQVEMRELVLPNDTNPLGNLLGGRLMHWIDIAGAMAASRHANNVVATVALDHVDFLHPVKMGEMIVLRAKVTWAGTTSMEVLVQAYSEDILLGTVRNTNSARVIYVALDSSGKPVRVPEVLPETDEEKQEYAEAVKRKSIRGKSKN